MVLTPSLLFFFIFRAMFSVSRRLNEPCYIIAKLVFWGIDVDARAFIVKRMTNAHVNVVTIIYSC